VIQQQPQRQHWPSGLAQRLDTLGLAGLTIDRDGTVTLETQGDWLAKRVAQAAIFRRCAGQWFEALLNQPGTVQEIWPGVLLIGLSPRPKRTGRVDRTAPHCLAALCITPDILRAEQLQALCHQQQLDYTMIRRWIESHALPQRSEVDRLASMLSWMRDDLHQINQANEEIQTLSGELSESYEELSLLYKLSTSMTVDQEPLTFLQQACEELQEVTGFRYLTLQLREDEPRLENLAGQVITAGQTEGGEQRLREVGRSLFHAYGEVAEPVVIDDVQQAGLQQMDGHNQDMLVVPLKTTGHPLGVLFGGEKQDGTGLTSVDSKLCNSLANTLAIFVENRMLYEDMHAMFLGTLHALTSAIDAKDSYTHGHTERVAKLSRMLAEAWGLDRETVERVYISGLVHDVGKIGVPESVLCKPGKLTDDEFALIKMHPEIGARILQDIRQMQDLLPGVLHHHERWDGRGYPHGLAGKDNPLFGRLIGLADAFDAMISTRTYRSAMSLDAVLNEIRRCQGTQFDPELVEVFMQLDFQPFFELLEKHQHEKAGSNAGLSKGGANDETRL
jgi:HD-GYP domain-containing protein (c-di-GMP phosphodiesterase class II)